MAANRAYADIGSGYPVNWRSVVVMSHANDMDGIASAALIFRRFNVPPSNLFFSDYSAEALGYAKRRICKMRGIDALFITDLSLNDSFKPIYAEIIKTVKRLGGRVFWFDHHPWKDDDVKNIGGMCDVAIVGENKKYCATEITAAELGLNDKFARNLLRIVHISDFNLEPRDAHTRSLIGTYALGITYCNTLKSRAAIYKKLRHIVAVIGSGRLSDALLDHDADTFRRTNRERIKKMLTALYVSKGQGIAVGFSKDVQSTEACMEIIRRARVDIGVYVNTESKTGHIRSVRSDSSPLARSLGGNGHPHASGFPVKGSMPGSERRIALGIISEWKRIMR